MNRIDLAGRVAVITGGSGGIGMATAERMLASGARVALWDLEARALDTARKRLADVATYAVDVTDEKSMEEAAAQTFERFGRIDILVNAAGITAPKALVLDTTVASWRRIVDINLTGTFLACRAVIPHMLAADYGRVVNLGSVAGKEGNPFSAAYSASKAAVHSLTKSLGKELAKTGIRVNCVTPAIIATQHLFHDQPEEMRKLWVSRVPMGRPGEPAEVAAMIAWLASEDCSFTTGAAFDLSGGRATY